jgi:hypothetical protein
MFKLRRRYNIKFKSVTDIVEIHEGKLKGHKGIQAYHQNVGGSGGALLGIVGEFEAKKSKMRVFHANQHVGQQQV